MEKAVKDAELPFVIMDFIELLCNAYGLRWNDYSISKQHKIKLWVWDTAVRLNDEWWENFKKQAGQTDKELDAGIYHEQMIEEFVKELENSSTSKLASGNTRKDLTKIAEHYGWHSQLMQSIEEMSELMQAISKYERVHEAHGSPEEYNLIEEVADVEIMMEQIKLLLDHDDQVPVIMKQKIERQLGRIEKEKEKEYEQNT